MIQQIILLNKCMVHLFDHILHVKSSVTDYKPLFHTLYSLSTKIYNIYGYERVEIFKIQQFPYEITQQFTNSFIKLCDKSNSSLRNEQIVIVSQFIELNITMTYFAHFLKVVNNHLIENRSDNSNIIIIFKKTLELINKSLLEQYIMNLLIEISHRTTLLQIFTTEALPPSATYLIFNKIIFQKSYSNNSQINLIVNTIDLYIHLYDTHTKEINETFNKLLLLWSNNEHLSFSNESLLLYRALVLIRIKKQFPKSHIIWSNKQSIIHSLILSSNNFLNIPENNKRIIGLYVCQTYSDIFVENEKLNFKLTADHYLMDILKSFDVSGDTRDLQEKPEIFVNINSKIETINNNPKKLIEEIETEEDGVHTHLIIDDNINDSDSFSCLFPDQKKPLYLRECLENLKYPRKNEDSFTVSLKQINILLSRNTSELQEVAYDLAHTLFYLSNKNNERSFDSLRNDCLSLLVIKQPKTALYLAEQFYVEDLCLSDRTFILQIIVNLVQNTMTAKSNDNSHKIDLFPSKLQDILVTKLKNDNNDHLVHNPNKSDIHKYLVKIFFLLINGMNTKLRTLDLFNADIQVLIHLLHCLTSILISFKGFHYFNKCALYFLTFLFDLRFNKHMFVLKNMAVIFIELIGVVVSHSNTINSDFIQIIMQFKIWLENLRMDLFDQQSQCSFNRFIQCFSDSSHPFLSTNSIQELL